MSGTNVFMVPCDPEVFDRTVRTAVDLDDHEDRPAPFDELDQVQLYGVEDGGRSSFEKMAPGDLLLFYHDKSYVGTGYVGQTFEDEDGWVASTFWDDAPRELVYTVEEFTEVSVPSKQVNRIFDYKAGYYPGGLTRVADGRVDNQLEAIKLAVETVSAD